MIHVIIGENHAIIRTGVRILLESDPQITVSAETGTGPAVLELMAAGCHADIVLADIQLPGMDGFALLAEIQRLYPEIKVIMLSVSENEDDIMRSFAGGARAYLLKNVTSDELIFAIKHVHSGMKYMSSALSQTFFERILSKPGLFSSTGPDIAFTSRELEILVMISEGFTNIEMSDKLFLSRRTVEGHRQALIDKTNCKNTASLIRYAVLNGLVQ